MNCVHRNENNSKNMMTKKDLKELEIATYFHLNPKNIYIYITTIRMDGNR